MPLLPLWKAFTGFLEKPHLWGHPVQGPESFPALPGMAIGIKQANVLDDEQESKLWRCSHKQLNLTFKLQETVPSKAYALLQISKSCSAVAGCCAIMQQTEARWNTQSRLSQ